MIIQIRPIISFEAPFQQIVSYGKSENPQFPRSSIDSSLESNVLNNVFGQFVLQHGIEQARKIRMQTWKLLVILG
jgi:hypothetical protein